MKEDEKELVLPREIAGSIAARYVPVSIELRISPSVLMLCGTSEDHRSSSWAIHPFTPDEKEEHRLHSEVALPEPVGPTHSC
jgi:hypothetical protein